MLHDGESMYCVNTLLLTNITLHCFYRYWLFGDKVNSSAEDKVTKTRGWFPRKCAVEIIDANEETNQHNIGQKKHN